MGSKVLEAQGRRQCSLVCSAELLLGPLEHAGICMRLGGGGTLHISSIQKALHALHCVVNAALTY